MEGDFLYIQPEVILEQYDIDVKTFTKGRGTFVCKTSEGKKILAPFRGHMERAGILKQYLSWINENGYPIEQICETKDGMPLSKGEDEHFYVLKDEAEGEECDVKNRWNMIGAMKSLAYFHKVSLQTPIDLPSYMVSGKEDVLEQYEKRKRELLKVRNYLKAKKKKNDFERMFQSCYAKYMEEATESILFLSGLEIPQKVCLCHGMCSQHSFLFVGNAQRNANIDNVDSVDSVDKEALMWRLVSLEGAVGGNPIQDVANLLRKTLEKNEWNLKLGLELLDAYKEVRPLEQKEILYLYGLLKFPEKFWKLVNHYSSSNKAWVAEKDIEKLQEVIRLEPSRSGFLETLMLY